MFVIFNNFIKIIKKFKIKNISKMNILENMAMTRSDLYFLQRFHLKQNYSKTCGLQIDEKIINVFK